VIARVDESRFGPGFAEQNAFGQGGPLVRRLGFVAHHRDRPRVARAAQRFGRAPAGLSGADDEDMG